jgi:hypothetical protein
VLALNTGMTQIDIGSLKPREVVLEAKREAGYVERLLRHAGVTLTNERTRVDL